MFVRGLMRHQGAPGRMPATAGDAADAHLLAEIVGVDRAHHRAAAGDSALAEGIKLAARTHQNLVWERTWHVLRLRSTLRDFFPAALQAFSELHAGDTL